MKVGMESKMKLKKILKDIDVESIKGSKELEINGISANSKCVSPGNLFISKKGSLGEGNHFVQEAIGGGAKAIVTDIYNPFLPGITQVVLKNIESHIGRLASNFYSNPSLDLFVVGITGTSGKTTTSFLVKHLLDHIHMPCGLIGTVEYKVGKTSYKSTLTTPDAITNHKLIKEMKDSQQTALVMEVSSHGLDQGRVDAIDFDVAIFTNLTSEHLDYHLTMEDYAQAKQKLFSMISKEKKKVGKGIKGLIVNKDCPYYQKMIEKAQEPVVTYGFSPGSDLLASDIELSNKGSKFLVTYKDQSLFFTIGLLGKFNISNCLSAIALGILMGVSLEELRDIFKKVKPVAGRLERVANSHGLNIFVDFAHKADALKNVLECLNEIKKSKIITVFGCGGMRDPFKRPQMAKVAEEFSDYVIVTSDNPREEDPDKIISEITAGFEKRSSFTVETDRRAAIEKAIKMASKDDIVLIAGKGHETYQIFSHKTVEFDDRKVAQEILESLSEV